MKNLYAPWGLGGGGGVQGRASGEIGSIDHCALSWDQWEICPGDCSEHQLGGPRTTDFASMVYLR